MTPRTTNIIHLPSSQGSPAPESSAGQCGGEKTGHSFTRRSIEARLNGPPVHVTVDDLDADFRIIGFGLLAGALFVVILRLSQLGWLS